MELLAEFVWKNKAKEGDSPVSENNFILFIVIPRIARYGASLSTAGNEGPVGIRQDYTAKAKYSISPIVNKYREGKVKSSPLRAVK